MAYGRYGPFQLEVGGIVPHHWYGNILPDTTQLTSLLIWVLEGLYGVEGPPYYSTYISKIKGLIFPGMQVE